MAKICKSGWAMVAHVFNLSTQEAKEANLCEFEVSFL